MFLRHRPRSLQFNEELILHKQICLHLTQERTVLVKNIKRVLLHYFETLFAEAMGQSILIDLLNMPVPVVPMNREAGLPDRIAELIDIPK